MTTVNDELTFESLPQETQDLVRRLYADGYFGQSDEDRIEELEDEIEDLQSEIESLKNEISELRDELDSKDE